MKEPLDLAYSLLTKADHDYRAAEIGIENDAPLDTAAFHLQQAAEKLIKAFLNWKQVQYAKTHALGALLDLAVAHDASLEDFRDRLQLTHTPQAGGRKFVRRCKHARLVNRGRETTVLAAA